MKSVLIVDDDSVILRFAARAIRRLGVEVICATRATDAMLVLGGNGDSIGLVVSDIQMPEMTGVELHFAMLENPLLCAIPRILMTGGTSVSLPPDVTVLLKPFTAIQLRCVVTAHIGGACPRNRLERQPPCGAATCVRTHLSVESGCRPHYCDSPCEACSNPGLGIGTRTVVS